MDAKLTYLFFLSFAACLVSSCSSDAPENVEGSKGSEITFAVAELSRASVTTSFNKFALYGDMKFPVDATGVPSGVFNKTEVEYKDGSWYYDGIQYWYPRHEHSFIAISPVSALETSGTPQYLNSQLSFTYIIPTTSGNEVANYSDVADIMAATHRRLQDKDVTNTTVTFRFSHIMSLINISPALDDNLMAPDEYMKIHRLELSGFKTKAMFNILPASRQSNNQTDDRVIDIAGHDMAGKLTIDFTEPIKVTNDRKNVSLFDNDDAIIMLPQTFGADSDARIIVYYTINDESTEKQLLLSLKGKTWESGKSYNYRFILNRRGLISETTAITDWDEMNVGNIDAH